MRFFVKAIALSTIHRYDDVVATRRAFEKQIRSIRDSGKLVDMGIFSDARGGYFIVNADTPEELLCMVAPGFVDHFDVETHPVVSFDALEDMFKKQGSEE